MAPLKDLREYLRALESLGDIQVVDRPVSPVLEAAAITRWSTEQRGPAPIFVNLDGAERGFRMLGAAGALSSNADHPLARVALSLGLPYDVTARQLVEHLVKVHGETAIPPKLVSADTAACKQNILRGIDATLDRFPIPLVHEDDGGPYVNTWGIIVAQTPDRRWTNWSISRIMLLDNRRMTGLFLPQQHIGMIWAEWEKIGKPMPFAVVQGGNPGVPMIGGMPIPAEMDEATFLGTLCGEPVELVKCETVDLDVPAAAEVVIEGHVSITRDVIEGPYAEFHGYALPETSPEPVYTIEAITYRDNPIWPVSATGRPPDDSQIGPALGVSAELVALLRNAGLPISTAWLLVDTACHWMIITVTQDWRDKLPHTSIAEFVHQIGLVMSTSRVGQMCPVTYVLDDDIDPSNTSDVLWALGTRIHPHRRQEVWPVTILPWYQCYSDEERHSGRGPIVVHDGLLPAEGDGRPRPATFATLYPPEIRERVVAAQTSLKPVGGVR
ncbi:UbiD-like decarboxylase [Mycobacterium saskatchewanense]|uniref:Pyrrole-2-carboxylic acid decarboxylase n=1 Tax=Mycobacterium saskatchewanense TaxID=220927 RepID=A0AAJ3TV34_9MYCO|nr:UbiD family decarboxylase [Mycobacterium saskatchewanense]ORW71608.1 ubiquinone biosynthesis protein UbiD [Mycobacterium saskatchewanense]BBX63615.1 UbiD-like decarboxylase [Mycobacterium saskatchewanense]